LPENATASIEILDRHAGRTRVLFTEPGDRAGHRAGHTDQDFPQSGPAEHGCKHDPGGDD
jgi:hypothetical protein